MIFLVVFIDGAGIVFEPSISVVFGCLGRTSGRLLEPERLKYQGHLELEAMQWKIIRRSGHTSRYKQVAFIASLPKAVPTWPLFTSARPR